MKTILLVRHAKTAPDSDTGKDIDRRLTETGHEEATAMAQRLLDRKVELDALVPSNATRAVETATHFYKVYKSEGTVMEENSAIYNATPSTYYDVIGNLNSDWKKVALFGHNPGITNMANDFSVAHIDSLPTAGVFAVSAEVSDWTDFEKAEKRFLFFEDPKVEGEKK